MCKTDSTTTRRAYGMKHFVVSIVTVLAVWGTACRAEAELFTGKWVNYRMYGGDDRQQQDKYLDAQISSDDELDSLEFRDGKAYAANPGKPEQEITYVVSGDKLAVVLPDEAKAIGMTSAEFYIEGSDVIFETMFESENMKAFMKLFYRRPRYS
jgi:hypothetical protein